MVGQIIEKERDVRGEKSTESNYEMSDNLQARRIVHAHNSSRQKLNFCKPRHGKGKLWQTKMGFIFATTKTTAAMLRGRACVLRGEIRPIRAPARTQETECGVLITYLCKDDTASAK